jgi:recombination protein RecA
MTMTGAGQTTGADRNGSDRAAERALGERGKAVDAAILAIEKQFGRGSIMKLGSSERQAVDAIPSGSIALDLALGVGGIPRGRITEIFGPESSGKTTLCQHVLAEAQRRGGVVAFIDVEHALDPAYARACGVNVDELLVSQPDTGEQALEITETLIRSGGVDCVVLDSVAALVPRAEIEGEMGDSFVGIQARLMSQALRKLTGAVSRSNTALVFTNQLREKIGVMFGNPETTPGGRALKFYASVRLDIRRIETIKSGTDAIGSRVRVKVVKNKVAAPFRVAEFDVMYGEGISKEGGLLDVGVASDVVAKTGAWFNYGDTRLGQGREQAKEFLRSNRDVAQQLEQEIRTKVATIAVPVEGISEAEYRPVARRRAEGFAERRARRAEVTDPSVVMEAAALFIGVRPRSVQETRRRLRDLGYREPLVEEVLDRLGELGFLDDAEFARAWVESRDRARPRGESALRRELALKGIDRETSAAVLGERAVGGDGDGPDGPDGLSPDRVAAERLLARRAAALLREPDGRKRRHKAYALLARNGFSPEICADVAATLSADAAPEDP